MPKTYRGKQYLQPEGGEGPRRVGIKYNMSDSEETVPAYTTERGYPRETTWRPGESDSRDTHYTGTRLSKPYDETDATLFSDMEEHDEAADAAWSPDMALNTSDGQELSLEGRRRRAAVQAMRQHGYLPESSN